MEHICLRPKCVVKSILFSRRTDNFDILIFLALGTSLLYVCYSTGIAGLGKLVRCCRSRPRHHRRLQIKNEPRQWTLNRVV